MADKEVSFSVRIKDLGSAVLNQMGGASDTLTSKLFSLKDVMSGLAGLAGAVSLGALIKDIVDLGVASDTTFRQIAANLPTFNDGISELKTNIEDLAQVSGRSLEDMQKSAAGIAQMGVSSAAELQQVLTASTQLADATGESVDEAAQLLIQLRREFNLTGDQALDTAAKLADIARGKLPITDLTAAFAAASPAIHAAGIDVNTATAAISALLDPTKGAITTTRELRTALNDLTPQGWKDLAAQTSINTDYQNRFNQSVDETEAGIGRANERIKNDLTSSLEHLGSAVLPPLEQLLTGIVSLVTALANEGKTEWAWISQIERFLEEHDSTKSFGQVVGAQPAPAPLYGQSGPAIPNAALSPYGGGTSAIPDSAIPAAAKKFKKPIGKKALAALDAAQKKMESLGVEFDRLAASSDTATSKSTQFALAIEAYTKKAQEAHLPTDALNSDLAVLNAKLASIKADEAQKLFVSITSALAGLTGDTAQAASDAIDSQAASWRKAVADTTTFDDAQRKVLNDAINQWGLLKKATDAAAESIRQAQATQAAIQGQGSNASIGTLGGDQTALQSQLFNLEDQKRALVANGATTASQEYLAVQREIDSVKKDLDAIGVRILTNDTNVLKPAQDTLQVLTQQARAIRDAIDGALQLGAAFHLVSQNTAAALRDVAEIVTQVPVFAKALSDFQSGARDANGNPLATLTSVIGAALPLVGGIASLVTSLTAPSPQEQAHIKALQDNSVAIQQLTKGLASLSISGSSFASATALMQAIASGQGGELIEKNLGHGAKVDFVATTAESFQELQAFAKSLGLTFDGSVESFQQLQQAAEAAGMFLGKLGTDYQSEQGYYSGLASIEGLNPQDAFNVNALAGASQSPLLANLLGGFDLNSQAGRDAAKQQLLSAYQRGGPNSSNPFTAQELGGLTTDQLEQAIQQWSQALDQLPPLVLSAADKLKADLAGLSQQASVLDEGPVAQLGDKVKTYATDFGSAFSDLASGLDLTKQSDIDTFKQKLQDLYKGIEDGSVTVDTSTFSIQDWLNAIADVTGSVDAAASTFESAAQKISDADNLIDLSADILGTPTATVIQQHASNEGYDLSNYDLTTAQGQKDAISYLTGIFQGLDPNATDYKDSVQTLDNLIKSIRALTSGADGAAAGTIPGTPSATDTYNQSSTASVTSISADQASGLIGEVQTSNTYLSALPQIRDMLSKVIALPSLPSLGWGGSGAGGGGSSLAALAASIGPIILPVYLDGKQIGEAVANSLMDPAVYHSFDRSNTLAAKRVQSGLGQPRT